MKYNHTWVYQVVRQRFRLHFLTIFIISIEMKSQGQKCGVNPLLHMLIAGELD